MQTSIEYCEWIDRFKPIMDPENNGDTPMDVGLVPAHRRVPEDDFQLALNEGRVWTLVDVEPYPIVVSGAAYVNRLEYYICEVAVPDGTSFYEVDEV